VVAVHLKQMPLQALYSSPMQRARETAEAIGKRQDLEAIVVDDLAEIRIPELRMTSQAEVEGYFTAAARRPLREHWNGFPGGEPFRDFHRRITAAIEGILAHYGTQPLSIDEFTAWSSPTRGQTLRIGIVAHGGANSVLLTHLLGIAPVPWEWIRFETKLAAYSVLGLRAFNEQGYIWSLQSFGHRAHAGN
jgi:broad specificity phosphatase PhoE